MKKQNQTAPDAERKPDFSTQSIHGGSSPGDETKSIAPPIHMSSSFAFDSIEDAEAVMDFASSDYVYTRGNNPTLRLFENRMAVLEEGTAAAAFSSGMAAISSVLLSCTQSGGRILTHSTLYGSSFSVTEQLLPRYGIKTDRLDLRDSAGLRKFLQSAQEAGQPVNAVFFETPANPNLGIIDIRKTAEAAHEFDSMVIVDNTFATPYLQKPLLLDADIVVHSATKYICGHGDAMGGAAVSKDADYIHKLKFDYMCELGGVMSPFNAWLMLRGLKTLSLRMERHSANAQAVAEFLRSDERFCCTVYPGLDDHPDRETAARQMKSFGGIISFELNEQIMQEAGSSGTDCKPGELSRKFVNSLELIRIAVSLGDCETLIQFPAAMTHRSYSSQQLRNAGLTENQLRLSVGIEDPNDIIRDIDAAADKLSGMHS